MGADPAWFGGRLRELREAAGLTQQQLADKVGCKWLAVSRWERGVREPGWGQVLAICEALDVSADEFRKPPAEREAAGPGRPRKDGEADAEAIPTEEKKGGTPQVPSDEKLAGTKRNRGRE
jgi:transcriptional regulator with XRE-family HTH domain